MESNTVKLREETAGKIAKIDGSIVFWSVQLGQAMMKLRELEAQVGGLYDFKQAAILEDLKAQGIDTKDCDITSTDNSTVVIRKQTKDPPPPFDMKAQPGE